MMTLRRKIWGALITLVLILPICSCQKDDDEVPVIEPIADNSLPSAAILNIVLLEKKASEIRFQIDVAVFRDSKNIETQLNAGHFQMDTLHLFGYDHPVANQHTTFHNGQAASAYSALMLLDQSGSITSTDPDNYRLDAAKIFCRNLGQNSNAALWSFAGSTYHDLVKFTTDTALLIPKIEGLRGQEGGSTPLYTSQYEAIRYTALEGKRPIKSVLTFTDGEDTEYGRSAQEVIDFALTEHVRLYNIGLGNVSANLLLGQSKATGGAFIYAKDAQQLISVFGNLGKLLDGTAQFYRTQWVVKAATGDVSLDQTGEIDHTLNISFPFGGEIDVPFSLPL
ncbi:vWA domain-containing protein [Sphingobacterium suaedae]|uniref:VWA domain-containing protein n=1 Tax=Sphingobacterium suaedae TaxID=1686402 RepID=A0ABW5KLZ7_9SPHI